MTSPPCTLRAMRPDDLPALCHIFYDAIHEGAAMQYDAAQRQVWAPAPPDPVAWAARLAVQDVTIAQSGGVVAGYMTLREDGYIDLAFVAPDKAGRGIGTQLLRAVEAQARGKGIPHMTVQASLVARALFARQGWCVVREQSLVRSGVTLTNFVMEKHLAPR